MSTTATGDAAGQVWGTANRLRAVQSDFADADDAARREFLLEEVDRALAGVVPDQRAAFLEQLQDRFPSWDMVDVKPAGPGPAAGAGVAGFDGRALRDWTFLVAKLAELVPGMSAQDRQAATDHLQAMGLAPPPPPPPPPAAGGWSAEHDAALRARFGLAADESLSANRVADIVDLLHEAATGLDLVGWNTWRQMAPQSAVRRITPLAKVLARAAAGDPEVPRSVTAVEVGKLRRVVAAMISSVRPAGGQFIRDFCAQFAPSHVEDVLKAQGGGGGLFGSLNKAKLWDQYCQMAAARDPETAEHEFVAAFTEYAERLMNAGGR